MFTFSIECSKDITNLNINFADGTSSFIGEEKNERNDRVSTTSDDAVKNDESKSDVRSINDELPKSTTSRKNLKDYIDITDDEEVKSFDIGVKPPLITELHRDILVSDEIKNGKF